VVDAAASPHSRVVAGSRNRRQGRPAGYIRRLESCNRSTPHLAGREDAFVFTRTSLRQRAGSRMLSSIRSHVRIMRTTGASCSHFSPRLTTSERSPDAARAVSLTVPPRPHYAHSTTIPNLSRLIPTWYHTVKTDQRRPQRCSQRLRCRPRYFQLPSDSVKNLRVM